VGAQHEGRPHHDVTVEEASGRRWHGLAIAGDAFPAKGHELVSIRGIAGADSLHDRSLRQEEDAGEETDHREGLGGVSQALIVCREVAGLL
jgi:hypothetical protein